MGTSCGGRASEDEVVASLRRKLAPLTWRFFCSSKIRYENKSETYDTTRPRKTFQSIHASQSYCTPAEILTIDLTVENAKPVFCQFKVRYRMNDPVME